MSRGGTSIGTVIWLIVGLIIAGAHHYFAHIHGLKPIVSLVLAILLWPLVLLGINLHIH